MQTVPGLLAIILNWSIIPKFCYVQVLDYFPVNLKCDGETFFLEFGRCDFSNPVCFWSRDVVKDEKSITSV